MKDVIIKAELLESLVGSYQQGYICAYHPLTDTWATFKLSNPKFDDYAFITDTEDK